jgi:hypothetical protein
MEHKASGGIRQAGDSFFSSYRFYRGTRQGLVAISISNFAPDGLHRNLCLACMAQQKKNDKPVCLVHNYLICLLKVI